jgi:hypothetical protein
VAINAGVDPAECVLPSPLDGHGWADADGAMLSGTVCPIPPRAVVWLVETRSTA